MLKAVRRSTGKRSFTAPFTDAQFTKGQFMKGRKGELGRKGKKR